MENLLNTSNEKEAFKLLLAVFQNAVDGIITITDRGVIIAANPAVAKLFGYSSKEILGKNIKILMPEPDHSGHDGYLKNYRETRVPKIIGKGREVKGKRKDGSIFDFYLSISEVQLEGRKNYVGIIHDISKEKEAENQLLITQNQFKAIFDTAIDGMIIISNRGIIRMANPAVLSLFQYELTEIINQNIKILMPEPYHSEHDGYISNYNHSKDAKIIGIGREVKGRKKDGTVFPFSLGVSEVKVGEDMMYAGILHDLTSQKEKENEIIKLNDELEAKVETRTKELSDVVNKLLKSNNLYEDEIKEKTKVQKELSIREQELKEALSKEKELNELKSRFVSMASHEFRTPLSTILSSTALIDRYEGAEFKEKRDKHISKVKRSVKNLTAILNDFLSLSKLEEGKVELNKERFRWKNFSKELEEDFSQKLKIGQKIKLKYEDEGLTILSDKNILRNIMNNLCSNAIKYSPEYSIITCAQSVENNHLMISIQDQGMGIPEEEQKHLFTRFFRAANVINIQGTGLGLTIVQRYLKLLEGEVSFKSKEGEGTTFFIKLPML